MIVAHDQLAYASTCLRSLSRWLPRENVVLIVNAPDRVDPESVAAIGPSIVVLSPAKPQGYGANLNLGVQSLPPGLTFAILANDDVDFSEVESVSRLVAPLREDDRLGAASPMLRDAGGVPVDPASVFPTALDAFLRSTIPSRLTAALERIELRRRTLAQARHDARLRPAHTRPADWIVGAVMAVRLDAFREVGGFDEDFFLYFEETDLCYRLWHKGWKVVSASDVSVVHLQGRSTGDDRYRRMLHDGRRRFLVKRLGRTRWAILEPCLLVGFVVTSFWSLAGGCLRPDTLRRRWSLIRTRWRTRLFLTGIPWTPKR